MKPRGPSHFLAVLRAGSAGDLRSLMEQAARHGLAQGAAEFVVNGEHNTGRKGENRLRAALIAERTQGRTAWAAARNRLLPSGEFGREVVLYLQTGPEAREKLQQLILVHETVEEQMAVRADQEDALRAGMMS